MITLQINPALLQQAFETDNKLASMAMPFLLADLGYTRVAARGGGWYVEKDGVCLKVRALTKTGVAFGPSVAKGAGRAATAANWEDGIAGIGGFLIYDTDSYKGGIQTWVVPTDEIDKMRRSGQIGADGTIGRFAMQMKLREF